MTITDNPPGGHHRDSSFEFGEFRLDSVQRMLRRGDQEILLAPKVLETLLVLLESGGSVVEKDDLLERIWPDFVR